MPSVVHPDCDCDCDRDKDDEGGQVREERLYYVQNWRHDVVALIHAPSSSDMKIVERIRYDAYGRPTSFSPADLARAGAVIGPDGDVDNNDDIVAVSGTGAQWYNDFGTGSSGTNYLPDGTKNGHDYTAFSDAMTDPSGHYGGGGAGVLSGTNLDNRVGYAGYRFDRDLSAAGAAGANGKPVYHVRHRVLDSTSGKWLQMDPLGYVDGVSLYEYCSSSSLIYCDFSGLDPLIDIVGSINAVTQRLFFEFIDIGVIVHGTAGPHIGAGGAGLGGYYEAGLRDGHYHWDRGYYGEIAVGPGHIFAGHSIESDGHGYWGGMGGGIGELAGVGIGLSEDGPFTYGGAEVPVGIGALGLSAFAGPGRIPRMGLQLLPTIIHRGNLRPSRPSNAPTGAIPPARSSAATDFGVPFWDGLPATPNMHLTDSCGCEWQYRWNTYLCDIFSPSQLGRSDCYRNAQRRRELCWLECIDVFFDPDRNSFGKPPAVCPEVNLHCCHK